MAGVQSLVAEHAADFIHAIQPADDQALQIQLQRDAQLEILVERVEMRLERARRRAACVGDQHRRFDLEEALAVQVAADRGNDPAALDERIAGIRVHDEIQIALAIASIGVGKAVEFLRQRMQALGQQRDLLRMHAHLAGLGGEHIALHADHVADVIIFEGLVGVLAHVVAADIDLDPAVAILQMGETGLAHHAAGHDASGDGNVLLLALGVIGDDRAGMVADVIGCDNVGILPGLHERVQLFQADTVLLGKLLLVQLRCVGVVAIFCHAFISPLALPVGRRGWSVFHKTTGVRWTCRSV